MADPTPPEAAPMREDVTQADADDDLAALQAEAFVGLTKTAASLGYETIDDALASLAASARVAQDRLSHTARPDAEAKVDFSGLDQRCGFNGGSALNAPRSAEWLAACERLAARYDFWKMTDRAARIRAGEPGWLIEQACVEALMADARPDAGDEVERVELMARLQAAASPVSPVLGVWQVRALCSEALAAMREGADRGMVEPLFVAGPVWRAVEEEDECWSGEIQTIGGHYVVAVVHGSSADHVASRVEAVIAALSRKGG